MHSVNCMACVVSEELRCQVELPGVKLASARKDSRKQAIFMHEKVHI